MKKKFLISIMAGLLFFGVGSSSVHAEEFTIDNPEVAQKILELMRGHVAEKEQEMKETKKMPEVFPLFLINVPPCPPKGSQDFAFRIFYQVTPRYQYHHFNGNNKGCKGDVCWTWFGPPVLDGVKEPIVLTSSNIPIKIQNHLETAKQMTSELHSSVGTMTAKEIQNRIRQFAQTQRKSQAISVDAAVVFHTYLAYALSNFMDFSWDDYAYAVAVDLALQMIHHGQEKYLIRAFVLNQIPLEKVEMDSRKNLTPKNDYNIAILLYKRFIEFYGIDPQNVEAKKRIWARATLYSQLMHTSEVRKYANVLKDQLLNPVLKTINDWPVYSCSPIPF